MPYKYATKRQESEKTAKALGLDLPMSLKESIEICNFIRGKTLETGKKILENVIKKKQAVPFRRFNMDMGHKKTTKSPGRYPVSASKEILNTIKSAEANAQFKGLNVSILVIKNILAKKASRPMRYGRKQGKAMKRTHIEVLLEEQNKVEKVKKQKKQIKKPEAKGDKK